MWGVGDGGYVEFTRACCLYILCLVSTSIRSVPLITCAFTCMRGRAFFQAGLRGLEPEYPCKLQLVWIPNRLTFSAKYVKNITKIRTWTCTPPSCRAGGGAAGWGASPHIHIFAIVCFPRISLNFRDCWLSAH